MGIKKWIKSKIIDRILILVFEKLPILNKLNGHKTDITQFLQALAIIVGVVGRMFDLDINIDEAVIAYGVARLFEFIARYHADVKVGRGLDRKTLQFVGTTAAVSSATRVA